MFAQNSTENNKINIKIVTLNALWIFYFPVLKCTMNIDA